MTQRDASSGLSSLGSTFSMAPVAALSAVLIAGVALLYHGVSSAKSEPDARSSSSAASSASVRQSPPAAADIVVLRLEKDGTCNLGGHSMPSIDLPPALREHSQKHAAAALIIEIHPSLPAGALVEVMEMADVCGIKRTAVRRVHD